MKKFLLSCVLLLGGFVLLCGYDVVVLSDTHYDSPELRPEDNGKAKTGSIKRNWNAWGKNMPKYLKAYRAKAAKADFVIHCGDIAQGYFSKKDDTVQTAAVKKGIAVFAEGIPGKFYCIKGNHENYCVNPAASSDKVIAEYLAGIGLAPEKLHYSLMHDGDLYVFIDSNKPDVEFVRRALEANPESRYTFLVSHFPILPCSTGNPGWITLGKAKQQAKLKKLVAMLAKRNAVILCGHIHTTSLIRATYPEGTLTQVSVFSLPVGSSKPSAETIDVNEYLNKKSGKGNFSVNPHLKALFDGHYQSFERYLPFCGLHLLKITDDGIVMEKYGIRGKLLQTVPVVTKKAVK